MKEENHEHGQGSKNESIVTLSDEDINRIAERVAGKLAPVFAKANCAVPKKMTVTEAAKFANRSPDCIRKWVQKGRLSPVPGSKPMLIHSDQLRRFIR